MTEQSDGSTAGYYTLPDNAKELQDLISYRDMNAQLGEIFRTCYRYGRAAHSDRKREMRKIIFYAQAELARLEMLAKQLRQPQAECEHRWNCVADGKHGSEERWICTICGYQYRSGVVEQNPNEGWDEYYSDTRLSSE